MSGAKRRSERIKHPKQPEVDNDLRELAAVLDEHRLDRNAQGWFRLPWRNGKNALRLAIACYGKPVPLGHDPLEDQIISFVVRFLDTQTDRGAETYFKAREYLTNIDRVDVSPFVTTALRCLQVFISNSSGSGEVYNTLFLLAFQHLDVSRYEDEILEARCRDAIGTTAVMQSDNYDRLRRAFIIAWKRGLFHAAYSLPPLGV